MISDSLSYLANNTDITYLTEGSTARGLVEATNIEIARLQEYIIASYTDHFPDTATGYYLDLIGKMVGVNRLPPTAASASAEDQVVQFSVSTGRLGDVFPNPGNANQGLIKKGIKIQTSDGTIIYQVSENVTFNKNVKSVFVPVIAETVGDAYNVGAGKLTVHDGPANVNVTNLKPIVNGSIQEADAQYRFRISNTLVGSVSGNETAVRLAAIGNPDVANVQLINFARGAGTFDVLLVPLGNRLSTRTRELTSRSIEKAAAFGINSRVIEPTYVIPLNSLSLIIVGIFFTVRSISQSEVISQHSAESISSSSIQPKSCSASSVIYLFLSISRLRYIAL